jgi:DNA-binding transcriptional LysR family regulator
VNVNLNLSHLQAFVVTSRLGSFTRAAQRLHVSQPAVTKQIRQLEQTLSVRLLDRTTRSVALTRVGKELVPIVERLLREFDSVVVNAKSLSAKGSGVLAIAALPSLCSTVLPAVMAKYRHRYSGVTVILKDLVTSRIMAKVKAEEVDLGIGSYSETDPDCRFQHLVSDHILAVFPSTSRLGRRRSVPLHDLAGMPLILLDPESSVRSLVDRAFESVGRFPTPAYEVAYVPTALALARAGLGTALLPSAAIEPRALRGLAARPIRQPAIVRDLGMIVKAGRSLSPAAESFMELLTREFRRLPVPAAGLSR